MFYAYTLPVKNNNWKYFNAFKTDIMKAFGKKLFLSFDKLGFVSSANSCAKLNVIYVRRKLIQDMKSLNTSIK